MIEKAIKDCRGNDVDPKADYIFWNRNLHGWYTGANIAVCYMGTSGQTIWENATVYRGKDISTPRNWSANFILVRLDDAEKIAELDASELFLQNVRMR